MRRSKIVCTIGPATESEVMIARLVKAGMNVARINCSHGTQEGHAKVIERLRKAAADFGQPLAILADLQGPKIRLGTFKDGPAILVNGETFTLTIEDVEGDAQRVSTTFKGLPKDCKPDDVLLIDDGNIQVRVESVTQTDVVTRVEVGGVVSDHKGLNLPGVAVSVPALSEKDKKDLRWALNAGVDYIALSFVRSADDLADVHAIMEDVGIFRPVIAKIEKPQAVDNLMSIVDTFDGIMVARGDLGVEMPLDAVPLVQKRAIEMARRMAKPVIVATQVLESMIVNPRPTRAEASDCANAILDGADAVMLSGETSVGAFPIEAVEVMARICESTEEQGGERIAQLVTFPHSRPGVITKSAVDIGELTDARYIVTFTTSGDSTRRMSRLRSPISHLALTPHQDTCNQLALVWGVQSFRVPAVKHTDDMIWQCDQLLQAKQIAEPGDEIVVVAGMPPGTPGSTNSIRIHTIGDEVDFQS
ncbi:MAG: pyruvate kinase [Actinomycetaceae bacterium]|nr:pyruvate kinase [Actinomycetaceae bacterium]